MAKKSKRPLLASPEDSDEVVSKKHKRSKVPTSAPEYTTPDSRESNAESKRKGRVWKDSRLIEDPVEREALEAAVFGAGFVGGSDSDDTDDENIIPTKKEEVKPEAESSPRLLDDSSDDDFIPTDSVWRDSDDEEAVIDLSSHTKLKKLQGVLGKKKERIVSGGEYQKRLKAFHLKQHEGSADAWIDALRKKRSAVAVDDNDDDDDDENGIKKEDDEKVGSQITTKLSKFVASSVPILARSDRLEQSKLSYKCLPDANRAEPSKCPLPCCGFIPGTDLLYTAGRDKTIRIFKVNGNESSKISSIHLKKSPIKFAAAIGSTSTDGPSIYFLTAIKTLGRLDVQTCTVTTPATINSRSIQTLHQIAAPNQHGLQFALAADNGDIHLCDVRSRALIRSYKMNARGAAMVFKDKNRLFTGDREGMVYEWDLGSSRCIQRFQDEGSCGISSMASSSSYLAVGSISGYVNIYDVNGPVAVTRHQSTSLFDDLNDDIGGNLHFENELFGGTSPNTTTSAELPVVKKMSEYRKPLKTVGNLTTAVTSLSFHPTGSILGMATKWTKEGIKLAHLPSFTIFANFPRQNGSLNLKYPNSLSFNDNGSLMVIGNDHGRVKLIQLTQFLSRDAKMKFS